MSVAKENLLSVGKLIIDLQDELGDIREVLKNMPGFPQGKVPIEVSSLHNKLENLNLKLQEKKGNVVDLLLNEQANAPQKFSHFISDDTNANKFNYNKRSLSLGKYEPKNKKTFKPPDYQKLYNQNLDENKILDYNYLSQLYNLNNVKKIQSFKGRSTGGNKSGRVNLKSNFCPNKVLSAHQRLNP